MIPEDIKVDINEIEAQFTPMLNKLSPWLNSLIHAVVLALIYGGSYALMQGGVWQTVTLGAIVTFCLKYLEQTYGISAPQG